MAEKKTPLKIIPLGGLDGIGKNMTVIEYGDDMMIVDAGLMFPDDNHPGIDLILPDYSYVLENEDKLRGIVITHGHEDHTGSLPYLLADLNVSCPIYSSKLTLGLIEGKLAEHRFKNPKLRTVEAGTHISLGRLSVDFFAVNHSIPSAMGVFIRTPEGNVLHTGDFKLDQTPIDGVLTDFGAISRFARTGIDLLLCDSTNANQPGFTKSESEVRTALNDLISKASGRVFVASFASHIHRLQQVCDAAVNNGRKIVVTGRSMVNNTKIARSLGYLVIDDENILDAYDAGGVPDEKVVVLCTGSQGEPLSALARMANGEHRTLTISSTDTVIISATPVPGNEKAVSQIVNALAKVGCDVYDKNRALVHVSGHAAREELKIMHALCAEKNFMPVHGETVHLHAHAELARKMGLDDDHIFILENGDTLEMNGGVCTIGEPVESGIVMVDGLRISDANSVVLRDRQKLAQDGICSVVVSVDSKSGKIADIVIVPAGVSIDSESSILDDATATLKKTVGDMKHNNGVDSDLISKTVRESLSNFMWNRQHSRPMIIPIVMEV